MAYLFENSLPEAPISWDGEPAPDRVVPAILAEELRPVERPKGDLMAVPEGSLGDVLEVVGDPERCWPAVPTCCVKLPIVK